MTRVRAHRRADGTYVKAHNRRTRPRTTTTTPRRTVTARPAASRRRPGQPLAYGATSARTEPGSFVRSRPVPLQRRAGLSEAAPTFEGRCWNNRDLDRERSRPWARST